MRYALIDLLALTLLVGLIAAIVAKREATTATAAKLSTLQTEIDQAADDCQEKQHEIKLFTRMVKRRATDLDFLSHTVDRVADFVNQAALSIIEPAPGGGTVSRQIVPTFSRESEFRERTIIYVPAKLVGELQVTFFDSDHNPGFFEEFEEPRRNSIPLASGENLIEVSFDWNRAPNTFTLTNHSSAISIRSRAKQTRVEGWSPGLGQGFYKTENFSPRDGMTVFAGGMGFKKGTRIVVQMVESKKQ